MTQFAENVWFEVESCCKCHMAFAVPTAFRKKRLDDRGTFYCPSGHGQHFTGPSEKEKLKAELERKEQMLDAARSRANSAEQQREQISKAHNKMRTRVMNGVCPCCNRTFQNLMQHMRSEHPDFSSTKTLFALRQAFGMTQAQVAKEAGTDTTYVSMYERDKRVPVQARERLDGWLERHHAGPSALHAPHE